MDDRGLMREYTDSEKDDYTNELINRETISKFIESSFNGNVLYMDPMDDRKAMSHFKTAEYFEKLASNKPKMMRKLHKVNYGAIFSKQFSTKKIDRRLQNLELDEKLTIIDNVIDYLHQNFQELSPPQKPVMPRLRSLSKLGLGASEKNSPELRASPD